MEQIQGWWLAGVTAVAGILAGVLVHLWWTKKQVRERRRIPKQWPLNPRVVANSEERRVWRWLSRAFFDYHVMIKLPVTRFTLPRSKEHGMHWYHLLSGVYCTFTVCSADGHVIGCVDVPGRNGISRNSRQLKQTLLSQCGIAYWIVSSSNLPTVTDIRTEFLGEHASMTRNRERDEALMTAARVNLQAALERQRHSRHGDLNPQENRRGRRDRVTDAGPSTSGDSGSSQFNTHFYENNSFLMPLDSRKGELR